MAAIYYVGNQMALVSEDTRLFNIVTREFTVLEAADLSALVVDKKGTVVYGPVQLDYTGEPGVFVKILDAPFLANRAYTLILNFSGGLAQWREPLRTVVRRAFM